MATRKVFFYEVRPTRQRDIDWRLDVADLVTKLDALTDNQRIVETPSTSGETYEFAQVVHGGTNPCIAYVRCRSEGLPMLARAVALEDLIIDTDAQLAELTHAVFFDDHVIGGEYNHFGPRVTALASYLCRTVPQCLPPNGRIRITSLVNQDQLRLLREARNIKMIGFKMAPQLLRELASVANVGPDQALRQMASRYGEQEIGWNMRNRNGLDRLAVIALADQIMEQGSGQLSAANAIVELRDGSTQPINLLNTRIGMEREMDLIGSNARSVSHQSAHSEISTAFESLEEQIQGAATLWSTGP